MSLNNLTDKQVLQALTQRIKQHRLNLNMTQEELSNKAGVHVQTIKNFESGKTSTLFTFIQILRAFDALESLDTFFPDPGISPLTLLKLKGKERLRASRNTKSDKEDPSW